MTAAGVDLLHDPAGLLAGDAARLLPTAATAGAQVRAIADQLTELPELDRPRALVIAGPRAQQEAALLSALAGSSLSAPIVAVDEIPSWVGALDTVLVLAGDVHDETAAAAAGVAGRRGATVIIRCAEAGPVAGAAGAAATVFTVPMAAPEALAWPARLALLVSVAHRSGLLPRPDLPTWAAALDAVALACHPSAEGFVNPAITLAEQLVAGVPLLIGADPVADALAGIAAGLLAELAGAPSTVLSCRSALGSPAVLRRAATGTDLFADPIEQPAAGAVGVLLTTDPLGGPARALSAVLPAAPIVGPDQSTDPAGQDRTNYQTVAEVLLRWTFAAIYLGITQGQLAPPDSPDGLGRTGTSLGDVRTEERGAFAPNTDLDSADDADPMNGFRSLGGLFGPASNGLDEPSGGTGR